jgi:glutamine amidotransferase
MPEVTVVDYGLGNLFSVRRGLEHCGASVVISPDPDVIRTSSRVVLPGVGAFGNAMDKLRSRGLVEVVREVAGSGKPLLGICLGMQLFFDESEEFGVHSGLGLVPGRIVPIPRKTMDGDLLKVPHIGWTQLVSSSGFSEGRKGAFRFGAWGSCYFVHSFMAVPAIDSHRIANAYYGGHRIAAMIGRDNILGCQFHPEKSGKVGLDILRAFCEA